MGTRHIRVVLDVELDDTNTYGVGVIGEDVAYAAYSALRRDRDYQGEVRMVTAWNAVEEGGR